MNDISSQSQPARDMTGHLSRQGWAGKTEPHFALDLYQVASLFDGAGIARNRRSLSRYCTKGKLDCEKVETLNGEEWRVDEQSVHRLIAQIEEQQRLTHQDTLSRPTASLLGDMARHDLPGHPSEMPANAGASVPGHDQTMPDATGQSQADTAPETGDDRPGQDETGEAQTGMADERLLMQLERENDLLRDQLEKKDAQIENKDKQIDDLIERGREDKLLIQNFQRKLGMLEAPERDRAQERPQQHPDQTPLPWQSAGPQSSVDNSANNSPRRML